MKNLVLLFLVVALSSPVVASAQEAAAGKNPCLLNSESCTELRAYTIQEIIAQLEREVAKGTSVYSHDELNVLQAKLDDYQRILTNLTTN